MIKYKNNLIALTFLIVLIGLLISQIIKAQIISSYELSQKASFNQISNYPVIQKIDTSLYRPTGSWVGRLILPDQPLFNNHQDAVLIELYHTPPDAKALIGEKIPLTWSKTPYIQSFVQAVTIDVNLTPAAKDYQARGNIIPTRLDGRKQVGPLESLAGSRPYDDLIVKLESAIISEDLEGKPLILTNLEPIQVTGIFYGLVKIVTQTQEDYFQVRHYNPATGNFDGPEEIIKIPQQPPDNNGRFLSTNQNLETSPVGDMGWYIYGAKDNQGFFTVQSLKPRSLFQLKPEQVIVNQREAINYINRQNWLNTLERKGTFQSVLINTQASSPEEAITEWQEGDRALVIHLFGGIGGQKAESIMAGTVTGHFAYGLAEIVRDPFTQELQFQIIYQQIYAHNPNAIVSGSLDWSAYTGNLRRGWLGSRPISDVLVKLNTLTDRLEFQNNSFQVLEELLKQTQIMAANYRTGNGTGVAAVTPATSCVQDSSQALYIAIEQIRRQIMAIYDLEIHLDNAEGKQFLALVELGKDLLHSLSPRGVIRPDWQQNAEFIAGVGGEQLTSEVSLINILDSWNSMLPRQAHDQVSRIMLDNGAALWFLRPNQLGGEDPTIEPIAPTIIFGQFPILGLLFSRLINSLLVPITLQSGLIAGGLLLIYAAIALPLGWKTNFLTSTPGQLFTQSGIIGSIKLLFLPALAEEVFMRVFILPHPTERVLISSWLLWALISLIIFIIYHPLNALTLYRVGYPLFLKPVFLMLTGLLGLICTIAYYFTGSLIIIVLIHWIVVVVWLFRLGGKSKLDSNLK